MNHLDLPELLYADFILKNIFACLCMPNGILLGGLRRNAYTCSGGMSAVLYVKLHNRRHGTFEQKSFHSALTFENIRPFFLRNTASKFRKCQHIMIFYFFVVGQHIQPLDQILLSALVQWKKQITS